MNNIREIERLNQRELDAGIPPSASWHQDWADTAYIYIGGLPYELSEGDIITIFSQYGEPTFINLIRDKETGKSKGFAFLKYEDQRSTALAVDNLGGAVILGRTLRVDHTRYKPKDEEAEKGMNLAAWEGEAKEESEEEVVREREPLLKEEIELRKLIAEHDEEDPMKEYLVREKKKEVEEARARKYKERKKEKRHEHHHRSSHRDKRRSRSRSPREPKDSHRRHRSRSRDRKDRNRDTKGKDGDRRRSRSRERRKAEESEKRKRDGRDDRNEKRHHRRSDERKEREGGSRRDEDRHERRRRDDKQRDRKTSITF
ncbi:hypothetical protein EX30DRAFT_337323 [Ascodesmis nigricans]|uniref:RRM domain-containing protein n=1 Tax=Ascodesmis nigricans TaxID=341454 RepID=A0A4S2N6X3_9PEZI|nr:hypothetical protein EX30DRAFT_337323 [Ascodesmis nigricans]